MATLYPVWRGSLTYHDGALSLDGAAIYRGTLPGDDDPAQVAIAGVRVGLSPSGIAAGQTGGVAISQRVRPAGLSQFAAGAGRLASRIAPGAVAMGVAGSPGITTRARVTTLGDLLAMGDADMTTQITLTGINAGSLGVAKVRARLNAGGLQPAAIAAPTLGQRLSPAGVDLGAMGSHRARVRQIVGALSDGQLGDNRLTARLAQAAAPFSGAVGNPIAQYARILYPLAPAVPLPGLPAITATLVPAPLLPSALSPIVSTIRLTTRGVDGCTLGAAKVHRLPLPLPTTRDLLPPSATRLEHLAAATLASTVTPEVITTTRVADTCPAPLLPWLAWARSVDWWELAESEDQRRALISASFRLHQRKGTPWAIKEALAVLGFGDSTIIERATGRRYDGTLAYNGNEPHGDPTQWAVYRVILARPVTTVQANRIRRLLAEMAPARCHLAALDYTQAPITYNGAATYNGNYNHGAS
ncbi:phage tail protein I [Aeromonas bivalvium]|uniref:phage tail protein I n=1 Tax=Aeromonas bivalvium TaxID=440079 RepID=UPI003709DA45